MSKNRAVEHSLTRILADLEQKPASYIDAARQIESCVGGDLRAVRVSVLSSFTAQILRPYIIVEGASRGLHVRPHFCPFNQIEIQALNSTSDLYESEPEVIVVALQLHEIAPDIVWGYTGLSKKEVQTDLAKVQERIQDLIVRIRQQSNATILAFNFAMPVIPDAGFADIDLEMPQSSAVCRANDMLAEVCRSHAGVYVFNYFQLTSEFGLSRWYDNRLYHTARIPFSMEAQLKLARRLARYLRAILFPSSKCLILDLDNTLWGGVLGEDGTGGIALGEEYPGNIYKQFQRRLISLRDQGILLAIASKNNESEVMEVFCHHPDMLLKLEDFAATQIGWNDKATSLKTIAAELNIGLDALAFFDDSAVERAWIRQCLPEVTVIEVPPNPLDYLSSLEESGVFDQLTISAEDRERNQMVQQTRQRDQFRAQCKSMEDFLRDLDMHATLGTVGRNTLPRVVQLLAKTNQFNLTTRRYAGAQLQTMVDQGAVVLWMRVKDRFGDNGLVGIAIAVPKTGERWEIDSFLLSCRIIGRGVDTLLLGVLAQQLFKRGCRMLVGEYVPTGKNMQVADFYASHGFQVIGDNGQYWALNLAKDEIALPDFIRIRYEGDGYD